MGKTQKRFHGLATTCLAPAHIMRRGSPTTINGHPQLDQRCLEVVPNGFPMLPLDNPHRFCKTRKKILAGLRPAPQPLPPPGLTYLSVRGACAGVVNAWPPAPHPPSGRGARPRVSPRPDRMSLRLVGHLPYGGCHMSWVFWKVQK